MDGFFFGLAAGVIAGGLIAARYRTDESAERDAKHKRYAAELQCQLEQLADRLHQATRNAGRFAVYRNRAGSDIRVRCLVGYTENGTEYCVVKPADVASTTPYPVRADSLRWCEQ